MWRGDQPLVPHVLECPDEGDGGRHIGCAVVDTWEDMGVHIGAKEGEGGGWLGLRAEKGEHGSGF